MGKTTLYEMLGIDDTAPAPARPMPGTWVLSSAVGDGNLHIRTDVLEGSDEVLIAIGDGDVESPGTYGLTFPPDRLRAFLWDVLEESAGELRSLWCDWGRLEIGESLVRVVQRKGDVREGRFAPSALRSFLRTALHYLIGGTIARPLHGIGPMSTAPSQRWFTRGTLNGYQVSVETRCFHNSDHVHVGVGTLGLRFEPNRLRDLLLDALEDRAGEWRMKSDEVEPNTAGLLEIRPCAVEVTFPRTPMDASIGAVATFDTADELTIFLMKVLTGLVD